MGTQQILLLVVSVIIVGVAIAVGITMFNEQAYVSNRQALTGEMQDYAARAVHFFKTPISQGGAGQDSSRISYQSVAGYIGFTAPHYGNVTENGEFRVISSSGVNVTFEGMGNALKNNEYPIITTTVNCDTGVMTSTISTGTEFSVDN